MTTDAESWDRQNHKEANSEICSSESACPFCNLVAFPLMIFQASSVPSFTFLSSPFHPFVIH